FEELRKCPDWPASVATVEIGPTTDLASTGSCNECCGTSGRHSHLCRFRTAEPCHLASLFIPKPESEMAPFDMLLRIPRPQLRSNGLLIDIFLLGVMDTHERLNCFNDALSVSDQIMVRVLDSESIGEPAQKPCHMYNLAVRSAHCPKPVAVP